jgi:DNA-binding NtrC family response regulator
MRVLIFDDDDRIFSFPHPALCPLHLVGACSCPTAQACGDIIISDVNMPNVNGLEFIETQIQKGCKVKNLALMSGAWTVSELQYAQKLGCQTFHKPFTLDEINAWIDDCEGKVTPRVQRPSPVGPKIEAWTSWRGVSRAAAARRCRRPPLAGGDGRVPSALRQPTGAPRSTG